MKLFKLYVIVGFILLMIGIVFDFGFVRTTDNFIRYGESGSLGYTWKIQVFNLIRFYLIILGVLNIAFALFIRKASEVGKLAWAVFWSLESGGIVLFTGSIWSSYILPCVAFTVSAPYYLEFTGLSLILLSIILEVYQIISDELTD